jgi:hypothetical protein
MSALFELAKEMKEQDGRTPLIRYVLQKLEEKFNCSSVMVPSHWSADGWLLREVAGRTYTVRALVVIGIAEGLEVFKINPARVRSLTTLRQVLAADDGIPLKVLIAVKQGAFIELATLEDLDEDGYVKHDKWRRIGGIPDDSNSSGTRSKNISEE